MATISDDNIHWLLRELEKIKESFPMNSELAYDIGNLISRFNLEIISEKNVTSEKKFLQMVEGIAAIWNAQKGNDKFKFGALLKEVSNLDIQAVYPNDLRQILSTAKATAANSANFALSNARNTLFARPTSSVVSSEQKQAATPVNRKNL